MDISKFVSEWIPGKEPTFATDPMIEKITQRINSTNLTIRETCDRCVVNETIDLDELTIDRNHIPSCGMDLNRRNMNYDPFHKSNSKDPIEDLSDDNDLDSRDIGDMIKTSKNIDFVDYENCDKKKRRYTKCKLTIRVYHANYGPYLYWDIMCNIPCIKPIKTHTQLHPFTRVYMEYEYEYVDTNKLYYLSGVVADTEVMRTSFKYLVMDDTELHQHIREYKSTIDYKSKLIQFISSMED